MGKKYIIEIEDGKEGIILCQKGIVTVGLRLENESELKPLGIQSAIPYTEPDIEQVRKEAYKDGYDAGFGRKIDASYQEGLNDLWEAMQKAIKMYCEIDNEVFLRVFHDVKSDWGESVLQALFKNTPQHLIDSIRQYEQRKEEQIQVGDEVVWENCHLFVTRIYNGDSLCDGIDKDGEVFESIYTDMAKKTGRHSNDIVSVLEKMREES